MVPLLPMHSRTLSLHRSPPIASNAENRKCQESVNGPQCCPLVALRQAADVPSEKTRYANRKREPWFQLPDLSDGVAPDRILPGIYRSVLILHDREPYLAWVDQVAPEAGTRLRANPVWQRHAILIPGSTTLAAAEPWLREWCHLILAECMSWYTPQVRQWPEDRSWTTFVAWFDLDLIPDLRDLGSDPLRAVEAD